MSSPFAVAASAKASTKKRRRIGNSLARIGGADASSARRGDSRAYARPGGRGVRPSGMMAVACAVPDGMRRLLALLITLTLIVSPVYATCGGGGGGGMG